MKLDAHSRKYVVINTVHSLALWCQLCTRPLPKGNGIPGVVVYMDDILITGQTAFDSLEEVLRRLTEAGLRALHGAASCFPWTCCGVTPYAEQDEGYPRCTKTEERDRAI